MNDYIERPLDFLNSRRGERVLVELKENKVSGVLLAFDIHINLVIEIEGKRSFIRGESVVSVS